MKKHIARWLRRKANQLDPPKPYDPSLIYGSTASQATFTIYPRY
jgi:hypothetical protein